MTRDTKFDRWTKPPAHKSLSLSLSVYQEIMGRHLIAWSNRKSSEGSTPETIGRVGKSVAG